jgi:hypothetical protein
METDPDVREVFDRTGDVYELDWRARGIIRDYARDNFPESDIVAVSDTDDEERSAIEYFSEGLFEIEAGDESGWAWVEAGSPHSDAVFAGIDESVRWATARLVLEYDWEVTQATERGEEWLEEIDEKSFR